MPRCHRLTDTQFTLIGSKNLRREGYPTILMDFLWLVEVQPRLLGDCQNSVMDAVIQSLSTCLMFWRDADRDPFPHFEKSKIEMAIEANI